MSNEIVEKLMKTYNISEEQSRAVIKIYEDAGDLDELMDFLNIKEGIDKRI